MKYILRSRISRLMLKLWSRYACHNSYNMCLGFLKCFYWKFMQITIILERTLTIINFLVHFKPNGTLMLARFCCIDEFCRHQLKHKIFLFHELIYYEHVRKNKQIVSHFPSMFISICIHFENVLLFSISH